MPEFWNNRGVALLGLGRTSEACGSFDRALTLDPDFIAARDNRERSCPSPNADVDGDEERFKVSP